MTTAGELTPRRMEVYGILDGILLYQSGDGPFFLHLHGNEAQARKAGQEWIARNGGSLLTFDTRRRRVRAAIEGELFGVDPNRLFSDNAIGHDLYRRIRMTCSSWEAPFRSLGAQVRKLVPREGIVSLHTTRDSPTGANMNAYEGKARLSRVPGMDMRSYLVVTREGDFEKLAQRFNVVYVTADAEGSACWYALQENIPYVNVSVRKGDSDAQQSMLEAAVELLQ